MNGCTSAGWLVCVEHVGRMLSSVHSEYALVPTHGAGVQPPFGEPHIAHRTCLRYLCFSKNDTVQTPRVVWVYIARNHRLDYGTRSSGDDVPWSGKKATNFAPQKPNEFTGGCDGALNAPVSKRCEPVGIFAACTWRMGWWGYIGSINGIRCSRKPMYYTYLKA